jgi:GT2 family glycosyltransferase/SAM-dependent methyltransferase
MASFGLGNLSQVYHDSRWGKVQPMDNALASIFEDLAERIILDLGPGSVLDVGCGRGYLVRALRQRGVASWGIDSPGTSIGSLLPESQAYCTVRSIADPWPEDHFDLIVCIDVLEHLAESRVESAVENLCTHSEQVLFCCSPMAPGNVDHINAQPIEYWAGIFDRHDFLHDLDYDAGFISQWAMRLIKADLTDEERLATYERKLGQLNQEIALRRALAVEYKNELAKKEMDLQYWKPQRLQAELDAIRSSNSWKFISGIQRWREQVIPLGSKREKLMRILMHGLNVMKREGFFGFINLSYQKLKAGTRTKTTKLWYSYKLRHSSLANTGQAAEIEPITTRAELEKHSEPIDIIICVHNALEDVQRCLASLLEHTSQPYQLILVDDGSDEPGAAYLRQFADTQHATLLRSETASGYTYAANQGMRASGAETLVLLNSDTILTPNWLDCMAACLQSDPKIGMVGPLSNTASWQSVPRIEAEGDWAANPLPAGVSAAVMAELIAASSARSFLDMPLLNGFCLMVRRKLLDEVGLFDENSFGQGYGEEDDLVLRARKQGWKMALADDAYVYHAQSKSYSSEKRHALVERSQKILRQKHGEPLISEGVNYCHHNLVLEGIRARVKVVNERYQDVKKGKSFAGKRLLFLLPVNSPGGGANVIRTESLAMQQMGVRVAFFNLEANRSEFSASYPELCQATIFGKPGDIAGVTQQFDAVIATHNLTVGWLEPIAGNGDHLSIGYYVQGFEPLMYASGSALYKSALESYSQLNNMTLLVKTDWTRQQVLHAAQRDSAILGPSVDIDLYRPRPRSAPQWPNGPLKIAAMIRPESPYREPLKTMQLLSQASTRYRGEVEINLFGTQIDNPDFQALPTNFAWKLYGVLNPAQVANLLSQCDVFLDYSSHQAMGLTAMEAMACGCAVIVPQSGGTSSYAVHEQNALVVDSSSFDQVWLALKRLVEEEKLREAIQHKAIYDICNYYPERAALNLLSALFPATGDDHAPQA